MNGDPYQLGQSTDDLEVRPQVWGALEGIQTQPASLSSLVVADVQAEGQMFDRAPTQLQ